MSYQYIQWAINYMFWRENIFSSKVALGEPTIRMTIATITLVAAKLQSSQTNVNTNTIDLIFNLSRVYIR